MQVFDLCLAGHKRHTHCACSPPSGSKGRMAQPAEVAAMREFITFAPGE